MGGLEKITYHILTLVLASIKGRLYLPVNVGVWIRSEGVYRTFSIGPGLN